MRKSKASNVFYVIEWREGESRRVKSIFRGTDDVFHNYNNYSGYQHKVNRLLWAREYAKLDGTQWNNLLFSDEARFEVDAKDHKIRCYIPKKKREV